MKITIKNLALNSTVSPLNPNLIETAAKGVVSSLWLDRNVAKPSISGHRPDATPRCARLLQRSLILNLTPSRQFA